MIQLNSDLTRGLDAFSSKQREKTQQSNDPQSLKNVESTSVSLTQSNKESFTFFYRSTHQSVSQSIGSEQSPLQKEMSEKELEQQDQRSDAAANNILKFIEQRLQLDKQDGATTEELSSRIDAALEGFTTGYEEANEILEQLNLLNPELESEISSTQSKVLEGIEQLKQTYLLETPENTDGSQDEEETVSTPSPRTSLSRTESYSQGSSVSQSQEFSFDLVTADGDKVTIYASSLAAMQSESGYSSTNQNGNLVEMAYQSFSSVQESKFGFSVEGDLDEDEIKAINDLLNNVNDLASDFYSGDLETAFNKAMKMDYDATEISEFSISLTQIQNFTAYKAYQTDSPISDTNAFNELKPLTDFTKNIQATLESLNSLFEEPKGLMSEIAKYMNEMNQPEEYPQDRVNFFDLTTALLEKMDQTSNVE